MLAMFLADGFEEIEALAVVDILRRAQIEINTVSINENNQVRGSHNINVISDLKITEFNASDYEGFILPGGLPGTTNLENSKIVTDTLINANAEGKYICAICAAPSVLGKLGLLEGKKAICYPGYENTLKGAEITSDKAVVSKNAITSKGAGTAHDFAFEIVKLFKGNKVAEDIKNAMQY